MKHFRFYLCISVLMILLSALSSCVKEKIPGEPEEPGELPELTRGLFLAMGVADNSFDLAKSRSVTDDNDIETLHAVYFQHDTCVSIQQLLTINRPNKDTVFCELIGYPRGDSIQAMLFANLPDAPPALSSIRGKRLNAVREQFIVPNVANNTIGIWSRNKPTDNVAKKIPMYAVTDVYFETPKELSIDSVYVREDTLPVRDRADGTVYSLVRMLSKIKIINNKNPAAGRKAFKLKSVRLKNAKTSGYVGYEMINWDFAWQHVYTPTLITPGTSGKVGGSNDEITGIGDTYPQEVEFYTFETGVAVPDSVASTRNCYFELTGDVGGVAGNTKKYMLPIPLAEFEDQKMVLNTMKPGPLLRNYYYEFTINGVTNINIISAVVKVIDWTPREFGVEL